MSLRLVLSIGLLWLAPSGVVAQPEPVAGDAPASTQPKEIPPEKVAAARRSALDWLIRHQHPDGYWSASGFTEQCRNECKNEVDGKPGVGSADLDLGVTALAMLAILGTGNTHREGRDPELVGAMKKAVPWLLKQQHTDASDGSSPPSRSAGLFGKPSGRHWKESHALANRVVSELLFFTGERRLASSTTAATEWILRDQVPGLGWRHGSEGPCDTELTGWMLLGLIGAKIAADQRYLRLDPKRIQESFSGVSQWLDQVESEDGWFFSDPASLAEANVDETKRSPRLTALGLWCRILLAEKRRRPERIAGSAQVLHEHLPTWQDGTDAPSTIDMSHWYWGMNARFQLEDDRWKDYSRRVLSTLLDHQRSSGDEKGSWDPVGRWGPVGGRVYSTAMGAMTLEVRLRFVRFRD